MSRQTGRLSTRHQDAMRFRLPPQGWRILALVEALAATCAVLADWFVPALLLLAMAALSLVVRRESPASLGLLRPANVRKLTGQMLVFAIVWTFLSLALFIPVANHLSGQKQDTSDFAELQGNLGMLALLLVASWSLAAVGEEVAFRGYLLTRLLDGLGNSRLAVVIAVLLSSLLFGLIHTEQGLVGVLSATLDGAAFAILRFRFGTVWASVLAHGFINTIGFVGFFFLGPIYGFW